jgi:hypothetical protein
MLYYKCHTSNVTNQNSHHKEHLQNCETRLLASSCTSIRMEQFYSHLTDFHEIWCLRIFWKTVEKIRFSWKYHKNNRYFTWTTYFFLSCRFQFFLEWKMFQTKVAEKIETHIVYTIMSPPPKKSCHLCDMWKNDAEWGRPQMTIWCMQKACCITKATETSSLYVIRIAFPLQCLHIVYSTGKYCSRGQKHQYFSESHSLWHQGCWKIREGNIND